MSKNDIVPGEQLTLAQINRLLKGQNGKAVAGNGGGASTEGGTTAKPSDGLKVDELRAALEAKGIEIPEGAKKADLQALLDESEQEGE